MRQGLPRYLPQVALATFAVAGLPALIASAVQATTGLPAALGIVLAMLLSILFARAGSALWMRRPSSRDIVFGDLMVWGWLRRMRAERRLAEAEQLLGGSGLSVGRRAKLLATLAAGLEARDSYTHGHSNRVARHSEAIAGTMGLPREQVAKVRTAAAVHDVGKIKTPRELLTKPGPLTERELEVMQRHADEGAEMVSGLGDAEVTAMVQTHHERLDGSGYPDGLRGEQVPLGARIIAVADTFDAMTSTRPYASAARHKQAMDTLVADSGARLDQRAVAAFRDYYSSERSVPWWAFLTTAPQRLTTWLGGALHGEGALPLAQGLSALGAAALLGSSTIGSPVSAHSDAPEPRAAAPAAGSASLTGLRGDGPAGGVSGSALADRGSGTRRRSSASPRNRFRGGSPRTVGRAPGAGGAPAEPGLGPDGGPAQQLPPAQPSQPPPDNGARPTVSVRPDKIEVGAHVKLPETQPAPSLHAHAHAQLDLPKVEPTKHAGPAKREPPVRLPLR